LSTLRNIVLASLLLSASALAQQPQEPTVTFRLPKSLADQLERIVGSVRSSDAAFVYVAVQNAITAQANADQQASIAAYNKSLLDKHDADLAKAKEDAKPVAPATPPE
jgi:hypothetical protein